MNNYKLSTKVSLQVNIEKGAFVPTADEFLDHNNLLEQVALVITKNMPILLLGDTGTGKTSLVRYLASKTNNGFRRVNHSGGTTVDDIKGKILIDKDGTYWVDGVLIDAMRKGYWYLADEINACSAEILFVYHSLLDDDGFIVLEEKEGEIVRPHPNFRFFASMNPSTDYTGTKELNKALLSRFLVFKTNFPPAIVEQKLLHDRTGITTSRAKKMVSFASEVRQNYRKEKITFVLSTRDLLMWANMFQEFKKYLISAEMTILNKVPTDEVESIKDLLGLHFRHLDTGKKSPAPSYELNTWYTILQAKAFIKEGMKVTTNASDKTTTIADFTGTVDKLNDEDFYINRDDGTNKSVGWIVRFTNNVARIKVIKS